MPHEGRTFELCLLITPRRRASHPYLRQTADRLGSRAGDRPL